MQRLLVDLYAGRELPQEMEQSLEAQSAADPDLALDMGSLRTTVEALHAEPTPEFTGESYQRVLLKLYARGVEAQTAQPAPYHLQYQLDIRS